MWIFCCVFYRCFVIHVFVSWTLFILWKSLSFVCFCFLSLQWSYRLNLTCQFNSSLCGCFPGAFSHIVSIACSYRAFIGRMFEGIKRDKFAVFLQNWNKLVVVYFFVAKYFINYKQILAQRKRQNWRAEKAFYKKNLVSSLKSNTTLTVKKLFSFAFFTKLWLFVYNQL